MFYILVVFCSFVLVDGHFNNVCSDYNSYYSILTNKHCRYDPDLFKQPVYLLNRYATYENHSVTTEDGYILTLFRLPRENAKGIIILQHPVTTDSVVFLTQGKKSAAFLLYNAGYEVWLPNQRGTPYSKKHVTTSSDHYKYWNFGFHEIGLYDYSAIISYVSIFSGRSDITFIGHSMSSTAALVYASLKPKEAEKYIKVFIHLGPTAYFKHLETPLKLTCPYIPKLQVIFKILQWGQIFGSGSIIRIISQIVGTQIMPFKFLLILLIQFVFGWANNPIDPNLVNFVSVNLLKETPLKVVFHYGQICQNNGTFRQYDYGRKKNLQLYNSQTPPEYPLKNIKVPIHLIPMDYDTCATVKDSKYLLSKLPKEVTLYGEYIGKNLNHLGIHTSKDRFVVWNHIITFLSELYK